MTGKIGLALGGGVARGWAHIGVIRALRDAGIKPDIITGTSMGAVVGGCYSAGHIDDIEEFARELTPRRVFGYLDFNLAGTGLINGQRLTERLKKTLGDSMIENLQTRFACVATEIGTGHEIWFSRGPLSDAVRASYALPGIFRPVNCGGRWLFDGSLVNPVPISVCRAMGARYVIAVNLNFDLSARGTTAPQFDGVVDQNQFESATAPDSTPTETPPPVEPEAKPTAKAGIVGARRLLQRQLFGGGDSAPGISTVMLDAFNIVQDRIARARLAGDPPDAMISPRLHGMGLFDFHRADELINIGRAATQREIENIKHEISIRREHGTLAPSAVA